MVKKAVVLFGTGNYFENYMLCHRLEERKRPLFAVDNRKEVVGTEKWGVEIQDPEMLRDLAPDSFYVVICSAQCKEIAGQLESMGVTDYQYYRPVPVESRTLAEEAQCGKPYGIGYVPGVFDLFHVGHLNLLRNSKSRCEYLIAGVLTDELAEYFKKRRPIIPYAQRAAIVEAITYVDRVVPVDFSNTHKIDAWHRYHFDCHFSGNDHGADWTKDLRQLREVGSNMEFFAYTQATSTTQIRGDIQ